MKLKDYFLIQMKFQFFNRLKYNVISNKKLFFDTNQNLIQFSYFLYSK